MAGSALTTAVMEENHLFLLGWRRTVVGPCRAARHYATSEPILQAVVDGGMDLRAGRVATAEPETARGGGRQRRGVRFGRKGRWGQAPPKWKENAPDDNIG